LQTRANNNRCQSRFFRDMPRRTAMPSWTRISRTFQIVPGTMAINPPQTAIRGTRAAALEFICWGCLFIFVPFGLCLCLIIKQGVGEKKSDEGSRNGVPLRRISFLGVNSCESCCSAEPQCLRHEALWPRTRPNKKPTDGGMFYLVGDEGLEPPTSSLSVTRSNQLS
jgi:hypothetical protein